MNETKESLKDDRENEDVKNIPGEDETESNTGMEFQEADVTETEVEKLKSEIAETRDKFLRTYSEFENYKKRTQRERIELFKTAGSDVMLSLLPVLDDFERALKAMDANEQMLPLKEGVELIYHKMNSVLEQKGLKKMNSIGEEFNVDHHEAITNMPVEDASMKGKVIEEAESGYLLNGKVIRHAKVIVGN